MKLSRYGSLIVVVAALLWSVDGLLRRHLYSLPSPVVVFWEHIFGFIVLAPLAFSSIKRFKELSRRQLLSIIGVSFLSGAVATILYTAALGRINYIPFSVVVLLQQLNPIFAITTSALLLRERLSRRFLLLALAAIAGAYLTAFPHLTINFATGAGTVIAALMAVGAAAGWGTSTAFSKYALKDTSAWHVTTLRYGITPFFAFLFVLGSGNLKSVGALTMSDFGYLVAITFSTGLLANLIYYYGLKEVLASRSAILELAWPASSVLVGYVWLHQGLTFVQAVGAVVLVGTIYLISKETRPSEDRPPKAASKRSLKSKTAAEVA